MFNNKKAVSLINPVFHEKTKDGDVFYDVQSRLIKDRVIFLCEPLTQEVASIISALLFMLDQENNDKITLWINTPGGDARGFYAIYDMMQFVKSPVETVCIGEASSAGALLLSAGHKGKRYATKNSRVMIHQVQSGLAPGSGTDIAISANEVAEIKRSITELLAKHTGNTFDKVWKDCEHDFYLNAQEALDYGIIDKILPYSKEIPSLVVEKVKAAKKPAVKKAPVKKISKKR